MRRGVGITLALLLMLASPALAQVTGETSVYAESDGVRSVLSVSHVIDWEFQPDWHLTLAGDAYRRTGRFGDRPGFTTDVALSRVFYPVRISVGSRIESGRRTVWYLVFSYAW